MKNPGAEKYNSEERLISRRVWLKTLGVSTAVVGLGSGATTASSDGFGVGGYGENGYGSPTGGLIITTDGASSVGETSATLNGSLTDLGGASSVDVYFEYRKTGVTTWRVTDTQTLSSTGSYSASVESLSDGVGYEYRAVASTSDGDTEFGSTSGFITVERSVVVSTDSATDVGETTATLNGSVNDLGNASSTDVHFEYRDASKANWISTSARTLSSTGRFSVSISGLSDGIDHEFRAVAQASDGDAGTGGSVAFTTVTVERGPVIERLDVSEAGSPNPHADISAEWGVSDADENLASVNIEVSDSNGTVRDMTQTVTGASAAGTDSFKIKHGGGEVYDVTLRVEDRTGNAVEDTRSVPS